MEDSVPMDGEIAQEVRRITKNRSGGYSGMQADHLKGCLEEAQNAEVVATKAAKEAAEATG